MLRYNTQSYLKVDEQCRFPPVVVNVARLKLNVARFGVLHVEVEDDDVAPEMVGELDDVVEGGWCRTVDCMS